MIPSWYFEVSNLTGRTRMHLYGIWPTGIKVSIEWPDILIASDIPSEIFWWPSKKIYGLTKLSKVQKVKRHFPRRYLDWLVRSLTFMKAFLGIHGLTPSYMIKPIRRGNCKKGICAINKIDIPWKFLHNIPRGICICIRWSWIRIRISFYWVFSILTLNGTQIDKTIDCIPRRFILSFWDVYDVVLIL